MIEPLILFLTYIFKIIKYYLFTILPVLIFISLICVLLGMCIRSGLKGGLSIVIIIIIIIIFMFIIYGKDSVKILSKIKDRIVNIFFSGKAIFKNQSSQDSNSEND